MKSLINNWKTTSAGMTMIIGSTVHLVFAVREAKADEMTWTVALTAIVGGLGLIFAGDASAPPQPPSPTVNNETEQPKESK